MTNALKLKKTYAYTVYAYDCIYETKIIVLRGTSYRAIKLLDFSVTMSLNLLLPHKAVLSLQLWFC